MSVEIRRCDARVEIRLYAGVTNSLTTERLISLRAAIEQVAQDAAGALLCGGEKFFSNGVDLEWAREQSSAEVRAMFLELGGCLLQLLESPVPIVGAATGHAMDGAMALLLACDYRYGAAGGALIGKPEILPGVPNP